MNKNLPEKVKKAINSLLINNSFYSSIVLRNDILINNVSKTAYTDGTSIGINPNFIEAEDNDGLVFTFCHETEHQARFHVIRGQKICKSKEDWEIYNKACDLAINPLLIAAGFKAPKSVKILIDNRFPIGTCAENIFRTLKKEKEEAKRKKEEENKKEQEKNDNSQSNGEDSQSGNEKKDDSPDNKQDDDSKSSDQDPNNKDDKDNNSNDKDSDSGEKDNDESDKDDSSNKSDETSNNSQSNDHSDNPNYDNEETFGDVIPQNGKAPKTEEDVEIMVQQAINTAQSRGQLPSHVKSIFTDVPPNVDWVEILAKFLSERCNSDYSFSHPNKRFIGTGFMLPSLNSETFSKIIFVGDTSGSTIGEIGKFVANLKSLLVSYSENDQFPEITAIWCDTEVQGVETILIDSEPHPIGGGGTSFDAPFQYIKDNAIEGEAIVYFTDGDGDLTIEDPGIPVIWCLTMHNNYFQPKFGEKVYVGNNL